MASNRDWGVGAQSLTIPPFAGPADPQIIIGPDIPAELQTYYTNHVIANLLFQLSPGNYEYLALTDHSGVPALVLGAVAASAPAEMISMFMNGTTPTLTLGFAPNSLVTLETGAFFSVPAATVLAVAGSLRVTGSFTVDSISQARGWVDRVSSTASTAAIAAETVILTSNAITWKAGRAYEIEYHQTTTPNVANNFSQFLIRRTNLAGAIRMSEVHSLPIAGTSITCQAKGVIVNSTALDILDNIVLTMNGGLGTNTGNGGTVNVRWLTIKDCGSATDYPNAIQI